jgi:hypothetical protein
LPVGDAWVWSPGWPSVDGIFDRVSVLPIETFDSGSTPKPGEKRVEPRSVADVDLDALRSQMSATIERAKADDPKELRKKIVELERELKKKPPAAAAPAMSDREIERLKAQARRERDAEWEKITRERDVFIRDAQKKLARIGRSIEKAHAAHEEIAMELGRDMPKLSPVPVLETIAPSGPTLPTVKPTAPRRIAAAPRESNGDLGKGERAILTVLAQYPHGKNRRSLGTLSGYTSSGGSFGTYLSRLRSKGYIDGADPVMITDAGIAALGEFDPLPRGPELATYWLGKLGKGEAAILSALLDAAPESLTRDELGRRTGYEVTGGSFGTYLSRLRTKELLHPTELRASEAFFE